MRLLAKWNRKIMSNELSTLEKETKSFLERCVLLLDEEYAIKYDERFWEE